MNLDHLRYFAVTARHEHITRAAEELAISQPALSRAIALLEAELGAPVFDRVGRKVRLNAVGRAFLPYVEQALGALEAGRGAVDMATDATRGLVRLGFLHTTGTYLVPSLLRAFRREYPGMRFQLFQAPATALFAALRAGEIDIAIVTRPVREAIVLEDLALDEFIALEPDNSYRQLVDGFCREAGFSPRVVFESQEVQTVRGLVEAGLGVAILPALAWAGLSDASPVRLRITKPRCIRTIDLVWATGAYVSPATIRFRDFILREARAGE
jgi:DNA-binding transcriptional LysR family regulator